MWIIAINGEETITAQGVNDKLNYHQNLHGESKVDIILFRRKRYYRTDLEDICYVFNKVKPVVSHVKIRLPKKPLTPKNICECLKDSLR